MSKTKSKIQNDTARTSRDDAFDHLLCTVDGSKQFANAVMQLALSTEYEGGNVSNEDDDDVIRTCGEMLALVHPAAAFNACMNLVQAGGHMLGVIKHEDEGVEDISVASIQGFTSAAMLVSKVLDKTDYWNKRDVMRCLNSIGELMDTRRLHEGLSGEESTNSVFTFDWTEGTIEIN